MLSLRSIVFFSLVCVASCINAIEIEPTSDTSSQADDEAMHQLLTARSLYHCRDYEVNACFMLPYYYEAGRIDSVNMVLNFWERKCGEHPDIFRARLLLAIKAGTFSEDLYDREIIDWFVGDRAYADTSNRYGFFAYLAFSGADFGRDASQRYTGFIVELAEYARANYPQGTPQHLFGLFYTGDFTAFYEELRSPVCANTRIQYYYRDRIEELRNARDLRKHWSISAGGWYPNGNLQTLGNHPSLGASYGFVTGRFQLDLAGRLRFLESANMYEVVYDGHLDSTDYFLNGYVGVDMAYEIKRVNKLQVNFLSGFGVEFIEATDHPDDDRKVELATPNLNFGLETRLYLDKYRRAYMSFWMKYNIANFDTRAGTDLSGNTITAGLTMGCFSMGKVNETLQALNFFD